MAEEIQNIYESFLDSIREHGNPNWTVSADRFFKDLNNEAENMAEIIGTANAKGAIIKKALNVLSSFEVIYGRNKRKYRGHVAHSINVFFLGMYLYWNCDDLQHFLSFEPGEEIDVSRDRISITESRKMSFVFRWLLASLFHDIGYVSELEAQADGGDIRGEQNGPELTVNLYNRASKFGSQRKIRSLAQELRDLPVLNFIKDFDDKFYLIKDGERIVEKIGFPEYRKERINGPEGESWTTLEYRKVKEETDILELMSILMSKTKIGQLIDKDENLRVLNRTFVESFQVGGEKTFDHGKIGAFQMLHVMRDSYLRGRQNDAEHLMADMHESGLSFQRANLYFDIMEAAIAIYLHNTLRFQLAHKWGPYKPDNVPPLSYLLMLCDFLVEWDKPRLDENGDDEDDGGLKGENVRISIQKNEETSIPNLEIVYLGKKDLAESLQERINKLFDQTFLTVTIKYD